MGFEVIEGGGGKPPRHEKAKELFRRFLVHLLRSVGGGGSDTDIIISLREFLTYCADNDAHWGSAMCEVVDDVRRGIFDTFRHQDGDMPEAERIQLTETCLRFAAEYIAEDSAAPARRSRHRKAIWDDIEAILDTHERKCRENGWSYLGKLVERADLQSPPKSKPRKPK